MKKLSMIIALSFVAFAAQASFAQSQKDLVIRTAHALETAPLDKETARMQFEAIRWVIETDEVSITVCGNAFGPFLDKKNKASTEATAAYTIGMAAFKLEHPEKASDENAAQLAGIETALKLYEAYVKEKPKAKFDPVEGLITKRNSGELAAFVAAANCSKK